MMGVDRGGLSCLDNPFLVIVSRTSSGAAPTECLQDRAGLTR